MCRDRLGYWAGLTVPTDGIQDPRKMDNLHGEEIWSVDFAITSVRYDPELNAFYKRWAMGQS